MLPGTTKGVSGLRFSVAVLSVLCVGFAARFEKEKQEKVLKFLLEQIEAEEPCPIDSLAHLSWEWALERVRLELEPDKALERIAELEKTPLRESIKAEFENVVLPGAPLSEKDSASQMLIPLRVRPQTEGALEHLARIARHINVGKSSASGFLRQLKIEWQRIARAARLFRTELKDIYQKFLNDVRGRRRLRSKSGYAGTAIESASTQTVQQIFIEPQSLLFRNIRRNRQSFQEINVQTADGHWLAERFSTDVNWMTINPSLIDAAQGERRVKVTVNTAFAPVYYQTETMLREKRPRSLAYAWYGQEGQGVKLFH